MTRNSKHVVPSPDGGWSVRAAGAVRASRRFDTQDEAIQYGRDLAKRNHAEFYIHDRNGMIREKRSYGNDPFPPRNKR